MGIFNKKRKKDRDFIRRNIGKIKDVDIDLMNRSCSSYSDDELRINLYECYPYSGGVCDSVYIDGNREELIEFLEVLIEEVKRF